MDTTDRAHPPPCPARRRRPRSDARSGRERSRDRLADPRRLAAAASTPGVYATFGNRLGYDGRVLAATLAAGPDAVASHRSALVLWDLLDGEHPVEITAPRDDHPDPAASPSSTGRSTCGPSTSPAIGTCRSPTRCDRCSMPALCSPGRRSASASSGRSTEKLVTVKGLRVILDDLGRRGRTGTGALRSHLDRRALGRQASGEHARAAHGTTAPAARPRHRTGRVPGHDPARGTHAASRLPRQPGQGRRGGRRARCALQPRRTRLRPRSAEPLDPPRLPRAPLHAHPPSPSGQGRVARSSRSAAKRIAALAA